MKKVVLGSIFMLGLLVVGCSEGNKTDGAITEEKKEEVTAMTCANIEEQVDELKGQEVTIKAISWGSNNVMGGGVKLNLGDEKLEGMKQAHVVVNFTAEDAAIAKELKKDVDVTLTATVGGSEYGAVQLNNPKIVK